MWVRIPASRFVCRPHNITQLGPWYVSRDILSFYPAGLYPEGLRKLHVLFHTITKRIIRQHQVSGLHETRLAALGIFLEFLKRQQGPPSHLNGAFIGIVHANQRRGSARGTRRNAITFTKDNFSKSSFRQLIGDGTSHHTTTYDDGIRRFLRHNRSLLAIHPDRTRPSHFSIVLH